MAGNAQTPQDGKLGVIGDSIAAATHSSDMCGRSDIIRCIEDLGGQHSPEWSYAAGQASWSLASALGFPPDRIVDESDDGEEWKDAFDQASKITADPEVNTVFINLGANDVCQARGHDYTGDLEVVANHIDNTLSHLTDGLPAGSTIYWSGVLNVTRLQQLMGARDHNMVFESCQATWDLDTNKVKDGAAADACDHFFDGTLCNAFEFVEEAKDLLVDILLDQWLEQEGIDEGPCGKLLSSGATSQDREEGLAFVTALNELMTQKARQYSGRNGVRVLFNDRIFSDQVSFQPHHVSRFDCYHPSRAGQMFLAQEIWKGFMLQGNLFGTEHDTTMYVDEFNEKDYCNQDQTPWPECWVENNDDGTATGGDLRIEGERLRVRDNAREIYRAAPLPNADSAWLSFNWRRKNLDRGEDYVVAEVSPDAGQTWHELDRFKGDADDHGMHRGDYYDISEYAGAAMRIRLRAAPGLGGQDEVFFDNVTIQSWRDTGVRLPTELYGLMGGRVWRHIPARPPVMNGEEP